MHRNGDSIEFLWELKKAGRASAIDTLPELDEDETDLWEAYRFCSGDYMLLSLEVYDRRIGLPVDFSFRECSVILEELTRTKYLLRKAEND